MKQMNLFAGILAVACLITIGKGAIAQTNNHLEVGDQAPQLKYAKWIKGKPVESLSGDQLYIIEFWATWCGPCKQAMPHLTKLQQQYSGQATFIGVNVWEKVPEGKPYETSLPYVERFVKSNDVHIGYNVIADNNEQFMVNNWLKPAGENGIPCTFIIKENKILWIGHPTKLDSILPQILNGVYDIQAARAAHAQKIGAAQKKIARDQEKANKVKPIYDAIKAKDYQKALSLIDQMPTTEMVMKYSMNKARFGIYLDMGFKETRDFGDQWLKDIPSPRPIILDAVLAREDLPKETYLWTANAFDKTDTTASPFLLDNIATCYARGRDFKNAALLQQRALDIAKKALKEGAMIGDIMDYTVQEYDQKLKRYKSNLN